MDDIIPPADVLATWAHIGKAERLLGWWPQTRIKEGAARLVDWYRENRECARETVTCQEKLVIS